MLNCAILTTGTLFGCPDIAASVVLHLKGNKDGAKAVIVISAIFRAAMCLLAAATAALGISLLIAGAVLTPAGGTPLMIPGYVLLVIGGGVLALKASAVIGYFAARPFLADEMMSR